MTKFQVSPSPLSSFSEKVPISSLKFLTSPLLYKVSSGRTSRFLVISLNIFNRFYLVHPSSQTVLALSCESNLNLHIVRSIKLGTIPYPNLKVKISSQIIKLLIYLKVYRKFSFHKLSDSEISDWRSLGVAYVLSMHKTLYMVLVSYN